MKKTLLLSFIVFVALRSTAQPEAWKWYFGYSAALDFSGGAPVTLIGCALAQFEGSASIADASGNLLFYTDGVSVWNKNDNVMPNGTGLLGDNSSTQSALIVPYPGSDSLYYIFTTNSFGTGAYYSIVDVSLDGGLGDVTATKNILLTYNSAEKLAGVKAANGIDYWVAIHEAGDSKFIAWNISSSGVSSSYQSDVGIILPQVIGQLQFSPDGSKTAMATYDFSSSNVSTIQVFDFDNSTGIFSNGFTLTTSYYQTYGLEFSPSGKILYSGANPGINQVYQWNLDAGSTSQIQASQTLVGATLGDVGCLQLATDGKIYVAQTLSNYLGVINNPDSLGAACDWDSMGVNLSPAYTGLGLPNFLSSDFTEPPQQPLAFSASDTTLCQKFCIDFTDLSGNNPVSWQWIFDGGSPSSSTDQNPATICYQNPGVFDVTLITTDASGHSDTLTLTNYITVYQNPFAPSITQNGNILTSTANTTYQWELNSNVISGATNQSYTISQSGLYTVVVSNDNGCTSQSSVQAYMVGINEVNDGLSFSVFPNPSSGILNIELPGNLSQGEERRLEIFNALGQVIYTSQKSQSAKSFQIDLSNSPSGVYTIRLQTDYGLTNKKIDIIHQ